MSAQLARAFALIDALAGHSFEGRRLRDIAQAVEQSMPTTLRDLQGLEEIGRVERLPGANEFWRISPKLIQLAMAHQHEVTRLNQRVDDFTNRYSRSPH
jgi:DNA-binding IclR family transcriptional regulator